eukprot:CAMPEP_0118931720 /NCGR_PEP_ID=MMETSP1169-20130426/7962_1 /TAXON_ID=36882 /ORGANISM="Pyramimonas obovata, Strain CCMP722" /LENGTH=343 /DNA_ID=CAMNT_0006874253 /DNA_START=371 /DNA_END=1398 /DNA_ORIENTATION=+
MSPRRLNVINSYNNSVVANLPFSSSVIAVKLNRKRLVVILERRVFIHDLNTLELLDTLETAPNPKGICALSTDNAHHYLALPATADSGSILVHDCDKLTALCELRAHRSPLALLAFSSDGTFLASASEKGTIIRVHNLPQASKVFMFRRGSYPTTIHSLCFSPPCIQPPLLSASSSTGTVHVFCLDPQHCTDGQEITAGSLLASVIPVPALQDVVDSARCLATIRLPVAGVPAVAAIVPARRPGRGGSDRGEVAPLTDGVRVLAATTSGYFYEYSVVGLDSQGEKVVCTLERESLLLESVEDDEAKADGRWLDSNSALTRSEMGAGVDLNMEDPLSRSILQPG